MNATPPTPEEQIKELTRQIAALSEGEADPDAAGEPAGAECAIDQGGVDER